MWRRLFVCGGNLVFVNMRLGSAIYSFFNGPFRYFLLQWSSTSILLFFFFLMIRHPPRSPLFPSPPLSRSQFVTQRAFAANQGEEFPRFHIPPRVAAPWCEAGLAPPPPLHCVDRQKPLNGELVI